MRMDTNGRWHRRGFTLVELLMVAIIIAILMSMLIAGLSMVRTRGREAAVLSEISSLDGAIMMFRDRVGRGDAPPSTGARAPAYIRACWTRVIQTDADMNSLLQTQYGNPQKVFSNMDAAEALVFWLGGLPDPTASTRALIGFSQSPDDPLANRTAVPARMAAAFDFKTDRLTDIDGDGWYEYVPPLPEAPDVPPYVYFDTVAVNDASVTTRYSASARPQWGQAVPYQSDRGGGMNPNKWQIVSSGLDKNYGLPAAVNRKLTTLTCSDAGGLNLRDDEDNLTNLFTTNLGAARQ